MTGKILIVDKEIKLRGQYQTELEVDGYKVLTAADGQEALNKLNKEVIDLIVLAMDLPDGSGLDYLSQFIQAKRNIKVVINTDYPTYKMDFHSWGADAFLIKSPDLSELRSTIETLLHDKRN